MPRYGDDQCVECGGIRVAKSTLCASCLIRAGNEDGKRRLEMEKEIKRLVKEIEKYNSRLEEVIRYGFQQNQEIARLHRYIRELELKLARGWKNEKDRPGEDQEG